MSNTSNPQVKEVVRVGQLPGSLKPVTLSGESQTVEQVLATAELNPTGYEIRVDSQPAKLDTPVRANQTVLLLRPVRGN